jgi:hypothetical protein
MFPEFLAVGHNSPISGFLHSGVLIYVSLFKNYVTQIRFKLINFTWIVHKNHKCHEKFRKPAYYCE